MGLNVPEIVFIEVDSALGRNEPDQEIRDLLKASVGLNLALDYLPGSVMFDPAAGDDASAALASTAVWFDAFVTNVDRSPRNLNLLKWHRELYFIDHGAALYFHHNWRRLEEAALSPFAPIREHILLAWATQIETADAAAQTRLNEELFAGILNMVPDAWLWAEAGAADPASKRAAYVDYLCRRLDASSIFREEVIRARAQLV